MKLILRVLIVLTLVVSCLGCSSSDCGCHPQGSTSPECDADENCTCKPEVEGQKCSRCVEDKFGFPDCLGSCQEEGLRCKMVVVAMNVATHFRKMVDLDMPSELMPVTAAMPEVQFSHRWVSGFLDGRCLFCPTVTDASKCFMTSNGVDFQPVRYPSTASQKIHSFFVQDSRKIYSIHDDSFEVMTIASLDQGWIKLSDENREMIDKLGNLKCVTKVNETHLVATAFEPFAKVSNLAFYDLVWRRWRIGPELSSKSKYWSRACFMINQDLLFVDSLINGNQHLVDISSGRVLELKGELQRYKLPVHGGYTFPAAAGVFYVGGFKADTEEVLYSGDLFYFHNQGSSWSRVIRNLTESPVRLTGGCLL